MCSVFNARYSIGGIDFVTGGGVGGCWRCMISGRMRKHYKVFHVDLALFMC